MLRLVHLKTRSFILTILTASHELPWYSVSAVHMSGCLSLGCPFPYLPLISVTLVPPLCLPPVSSFSVSSQHFPMSELSIKHDIVIFYFFTYSSLMCPIPPLLLPGPTPQGFSSQWHASPSSPENCHGWFPCHSHLEAIEKRVSIPPSAEPYIHANGSWCTQPHPECAVHDVLV
jgi:hypothetical protein